MKEQSKAIARRVVSALNYYSGQSLKKLYGRILILMYHRVVSERELGRYFIQPGMYVRKEVFEMQMKFLKEHFEIISFHDLLERWKNKRFDNAKRYAVITFDDGWLDNYIHAYPILMELSIPATIFLPTDFVGTNKWFWPDELSYLLKQLVYAYLNEKSKSLVSLTSQFPSLKDLKGKKIREEIDTVIERVKKLPDEEIHEIIGKLKKSQAGKMPGERALISWEEAEEMSAFDISFGSHSCSHAILTKCSGEAVRAEIEASRDALRGKNINWLPVFCYPNGNYTDVIAGQVEAAGYAAAVSTRLGSEDFVPRNMFALRRIGIHNDISATTPMFAFHLAMSATSRMNRKLLACH